MSCRRIPQTGCAHTKIGLPFCGLLLGNTNIRLKIRCLSLHSALMQEPVLILTLGTESIFAEELTAVQKVLPYSGRTATNIISTTYLMYLIPTAI